MGIWPRRVRGFLERNIIPRNTRTGHLGLPVAGRAGFAIEAVGRVVAPCEEERALAHEAQADGPTSVWTRPRATARLTRPHDGPWLRASILLRPSPSQRLVVSFRPSIDLRENISSYVRVYPVFAIRH